MDHFHLHCVKTRLLWKLLFPLFGITWDLLLFGVGKVIWLAKNRKRFGKDDYIYFGQFGRLVIGLFLGMRCCLYID